MRNGSKRLVGSLLLLVAAVPVPSFATSADFNQQMPLGGLHATVATGGHAARFPHRCARFWTGRSIRRRIGSASGRTGSPAMGHGSRRRSGWPCKWVRASVRSIRTAVATIARACFAGFNMRPIRIQGHVASDAAARDARPVHRSAACAGSFVCCCRTGGSSRLSDGDTFSQNLFSTAHSAIVCRSGFGAAYGLLVLPLPVSLCYSDSYFLECCGGAPLHQPFRFCFCTARSSRIVHAVPVPPRAAPAPMMKIVPAAACPAASIHDEDLPNAAPVISPTSPRRAHFTPRPHAA